MEGISIWLLTQLEYLLRIFIAALCGGVIGYERENRLKSAGIRTHLIVSVAAALMMIVSKYGFLDILQVSGVGLDPSRIGAGVVTAVGFLGAGVIFVRKQTISGITTAAGIWATVGVGIAIGAGMYLVGVVTAALIIIIQILLHRHTKLVKDSMAEQITLEINQEDDLDQLLKEIFVSHEIEIGNFKAKKLPNGLLEVKLYVRYPDVYEIADILKLLRDIPNIKAIEI